MKVLVFLYFAVALLLPAVAAKRGCRLLRKESKTTKACREQKGHRNRNIDGNKLPVCAGIRGNGPRLFAHFPALARVVEALGPIHGVSGGSSGTVTSFLLESIEGNRLVRECGNTCCSLEEQVARISFLLKSTQALPEESNLAVQGALKRVMQQIGQENILQRLQSDDSAIQQQALEDLLTILTNQTPANLINPEVIDLLVNKSTDPIFHAKDILSASSGDFQISNDPLVFIRPYLLNFKGAAEWLDVIASFYRGLEPIDADALESLLDACALKSLKLKWNEIEALSFTDGTTCSEDSAPSKETTCGEAFAALYQDFVAKRDSSSPRRVDDKLGETLQTLITTSVLSGDGYSLWEQSIVDYEQMKLPVNFNASFTDIDFGYFGDRKSLRRVSKQLPKLFDDAKSEQFLSLGETTWKEALIRSPAEPSLSRGVLINDKWLSLGGWTDPVPAQVLTAMGCDKIVLINRPKGTGTFPVEIATLLGISEKELKDLYELSDPKSSFTTALSTADATICADWDAPESNADALAEAGYNGPFMSTDPCIMSLNVGTTDEEKIVGCTPLVVSEEAVATE